MVNGADMSLMSLERIDIGPVRGKCGQGEAVVAHFGAAFRREGVKLFNLDYAAEKGGK